MAEDFTNHFWSTEDRTEMVRLVTLYHQPEEARNHWVGSIVPDARTFSRVYNKFAETGSVEDRSRSGRPRSACSDESLEKIRTAIETNPTRSERELASDLSIARSSLNRGVKEMGYKSYIIQKTQFHYDQDYAIREECCKHLVHLCTRKPTLLKQRVLPREPKTKADLELVIREELSKIPARMFVDAVGITHSNPKQTTPPLFSLPTLPISSIDPQIKRGAIHCIGSLDIVDEGPFVLAEKSQLAEMESKDRTIAEQKQKLAQHDQLIAKQKEVERKMAEQEKKLAEQNKLIESLEATRKSFSELEQKHDKLQAKLSAKDHTMGTLKRVLMILTVLILFSVFVVKSFHGEARQIRQVNEQLRTDLVSNAEKEETHLSSLQAQLRDEKEQIQKESEECQGDLAIKTRMVEAKKTRLTQAQQTIEAMKTEEVRKEELFVSSNILVAYTPHRYRMNGSTLTRINSEGHGGCFTKPVSKGIHRLSIKPKTTNVMFGVLDAAEFPKFITTPTCHSPKAALMHNSNGCLYTAEKKPGLNRVGLGSDLKSLDADLQIGLGADLKVYTQISFVSLIEHLIEPIVKNK
ncbi:hypothetical protein BLNAU_9778 [Blattamonas nauphoetae]|uniref:Uncharacterized protein n=1 Tax=Blattamonas nauphoetae TaxID=2049346 RepID=A0ABQ9XUR6_9EUKA|nr:hypothetical protein BLNAU_9778 [Blattamonas nauphoetae]